MAAKDRLRELIQEWKDRDTYIKNNRDIAASQTDPHQPDQERIRALKEARDRRHELAGLIFDVIVANPRLADEAERMGFTHEKLDPDDPPSTNPVTGSSVPTPTPNERPPADPQGRDPVSHTGAQGPQSGSSGGSSTGGRGGRDRDQGGTGTQGPPSDAGEGPDTGGGSTGASGAGSGGGGGGGAQNQPRMRAQARDNRLLGEEGKEFDLVRGPKGTFVAAYTYKIDGHEVVVGIRLGNDPDKLARYGLRARDAKDLTREQMRRIKNIGHADALAPHIRRGDGDVFDALVRSLETQYEGQPILRHKDVMAKVIARSMFGWTDPEFENQIKTTRWYDKTEPYQREWQTTMSDKQKKNQINRTLETVVNRLEDLYGLTWTQHVEGGMKQARTWAEKIASGAWGTPDVGLGFWEDRTFDKAAKIDGTPAWLQQQSEQEQINAQLNRPEDVFEQLRSEALGYLGQDADDTPRIDRGTLKRWATDLVSGAKSDGDWRGFLRQQMKTLFPYFDPNVAYQDQAAPFKSIAERINGDVLDWSDPLLKDFAATDENGKATGNPMSLRDYELMLRDPERNPRAYKEGTPLFDEGMNVLSRVLYKMRGVA